MGRARSDVMIVRAVQRLVAATHAAPHNQCGGYPPPRLTRLRDDRNEGHIWKRSGAGFPRTSSLEIIMLRNILLAAAFGAVAVPAFADTAVRVSVAGLDAKAAHTAIFHAAQLACRVELAQESDVVRFYNRPACVQAAIADAETRFSAMRGLASR
jgi:hypothetical protein